MTIGAAIFLLEAIWPGLVAALAAGLVVGALSVSRCPAPWIGWAAVVAAGVGLVAAAVLAILGEVGGRPGLWLELALWLLTAYVAGCCVGTLVRRALNRSPHIAMRSHPDR